mgnify:CR=1 FL=1
MHFIGNLALYAFKKRDRATIVADILKSVGSSFKGRRKTNIMQCANLSFDQANKYLEVLLSNGYVILDGGYMYRLTTKGLTFLRNLETDYLRLKFKS